MCRTDLYMDGCRKLGHKHEVMDVVGREVERGTVKRRQSYTRRLDAIIGV